MNEPQELYVKPGLPERQFLTFSTSPFDAMKDTGFKLYDPWSKDNDELVCVEMRANPLDSASVNGGHSRWQVTCFFENWRLAVVRSCYFQEIV